MKLRALGTGGPFCRWPLIPACWLIQTHNSNVLINCPPQVCARLEFLGLKIDSIDMIVPLGSKVSDIGGLEEFGYRNLQKDNKPYLACPEKLWGELTPKVDYLDGFQKKFVKKIGFKEEHITETLTFITNGTNYGFRLEFAKILCCGGILKPDEQIITANEDCQLILHANHKDLTELPVYLQNRMWLFGYDEHTEGSDPLPMLFLPQSAWIYDSDRRDKVLTKERYIRENSKRVIGNENLKSL